MDLNTTGKELCARLERMEREPSWYRRRLFSMRATELLYHCSAEADDAVLGYFAVNGCHLRGKTLLLLVFSAETDTEHPEPFERMGAYRLVEEVSEEVFSGVFEHWSSEADGRFTVLLLNPGSMAHPGETPESCCSRIAALCRERYALPVTVYMGEPFSDIHSTTAVYNRLLSTVNYHRYIRRAPDTALCRIADVPSSAAAARMTVLRERVHALTGAFVGGSDYIPEAERALNGFLLSQANSVEALHRLFGDFFELLCIELSRLGVRVPTDRLRSELLALCDTATDWQTVEDWFFRALSDLHTSRQREKRSSAVQYAGAVDYIRRNLARTDLTPEDCAGAVGCSTAALGKLFREQLGTSLSQYIRQERLELAAELLREGRSVRETYAAAGFGSAESFHRVFKRRYGITPGQLRTVTPPPPEVGEHPETGSDFSPGIPS